MSAGIRMQVTKRLMWEGSEPGREEERRRGGEGTRVFSGYRWEDQPRSISCDPSID